MAFERKNLTPLVQGANGFTFWHYASTDAVVGDADGYFTQAAPHAPFKVGDLIYQIDTNAVDGKLLVVSAINAATGVVTVELLNAAALS